MKIETILVYCPHEGLNRSLFLNYAAETVVEIADKQNNQEDPNLKLFCDFLKESSLYTMDSRFEHDMVMVQEFGGGIPAAIQLARDLGWRVEFVGNIYDDPDFRPFG